MFCHISNFTEAALSAPYRLSTPVFEDQDKEHRFLQETIFPYCSDCRKFLELERSCGPRDWSNDGLFVEINVWFLVCRFALFVFYLSFKKHCVCVGYFKELILTSYLKQTTGLLVNVLVTKEPNRTLGTLTCCFSA